MQMWLSRPSTGRLIRACAEVKPPFGWGQVPAWDRAGAGQPPGRGEWPHLCLAVAVDGHEPGPGGVHNGEYWRSAEPGGRRQGCGQAAVMRRVKEHQGPGVPAYRD